MRDDQLTITLVGKSADPPVESFMVVMYNMIKILKDVEAVASNHQSRMSWSFSRVSMNSPLTIAIFPETPNSNRDSGKEVLQMSRDGIATLQSNQNTMPFGFRERSLIAASKIAHVLSKDVVRITISTPYGEPLDIAPSLYANAVAIANRSYTDYGSLEGKVVTLSIRNSAQFGIADQIYGYVPCRFDKEELLDTIRPLVDERVEAFGQVRYSSLGVPESILVERVSTFKPNSELPQFFDVPAFVLKQPRTRRSTGPMTL